MLLGKRYKTNRWEPLDIGRHTTGDSIGSNDRSPVPAVFANIPSSQTNCWHGPSIGCFATPCYCPYWELCWSSGATVMCVRKYFCSRRVRVPSPCPMRWLLSLSRRMLLRWPLRLRAWGRRMPDVYRRSILSVVFWSPFPCM